MTIDVHFHAASVDELHTQMRAMLGGIPEVASPPTAPADSAPKRQTAAEKKAAEKAAAEAAAAEVAAKTPEKVEETKQDAKDEAAEQKAPEPMKLNHDHIKTVLSGYVMAYGMENTQADGPDFLGFPKISEIPDDQGKIATAIVNIASAIEKNPKKRDMAGDGLSAEKIEQMKPIVQAAKAALK